MVSKEFGYWFAGFCDGEASFGANMDSQHRYIPIVQFVITLRIDDEPTLQYIKEQLGFGEVYDHHINKKHRQGYISNPTKAFHVNKKSDTAALVDIFRRYPLRSKKARDFEVWAEIVELRNQRDWRGKVTPEKLAVMQQGEILVAKLREVRAFKG